jgi:GTPase
MKIALVGRPNVGKSALFNRICQKRISIVDDMEGVTRDRIYAKAEINSKEFDLIDTGGISFEKNQPFIDQVRMQAEIAIEEADAIIMVVDLQAKVQVLDKEIARILLSTKKPIVLAINKADDAVVKYDLFNFYELGIETMLDVSAVHGRNVFDLIEIVFQKLPKQLDNEIVEENINVAIVGRTNVGKSTLLNALLGSERCIVSDIAGTTRDAIDVFLKHDNERFLFIDTAGIRRKHKEKEVVEKFSYLRTQNAMKRANICILIVDANEGLTTQEKRILKDIESLGKGCIIFINKWDLVKGFRMEHCIASMKLEYSSIKNFPIIVGSAMQKRNIDKILESLLSIKSQIQMKIPTPQLNNFIEKSMQKIHPPMIKGKRLRIFYMVQKNLQPKRFILFVNYPNLMTKAYKQYLINSFRTAYSLIGCPFDFILRARSSRR